MGQEAEKGRAAAAALLGGDGTAVGGRLTWTEPEVRAGLDTGTGPRAWIAFDKEVRILQRAAYGVLRSTRVEARLCHADGRIRAAALGAWRFPPLELVLIRCTDWARAVRERAREVLGGALGKDPEDALVGLAPLVLRLGRREHGAWAVEQLEAALSGRDSVFAAWWRPDQLSTTSSPQSLTDAQRTSVMDRLHLSRDLPTRQFTARLAVAPGHGIGVRELARRAAAELDPLAARLWNDAALAALAADGPDDEAVDTLLRARIPMVRAAGVTALRRAGRAEEASLHLVDRSGLVRACARWLVKQDGGDPYARYRALLEGPEPVSPYAVTGFSECAGRPDAPLVRGLLEHPEGAVRAAALAGLRRMNGHVEDAVLVPLLDDPSASVTREASLSLLPAARRLDPGHLTARIAPERPPHVRRAAFRLLYERGGMARLRASVALLEDSDPGLRETARETVCLWDCQATLRTSEGDPVELGGLLTRSAHLFSDYQLALRRSRLGLTD
ncbi:HEAT repeat domain-containing protein [Streptomyces sp. NBC_00454]|uniref:HEAT repeat domain-containing protein n=1 Tax=Streptomyces sp. NBC_00454 TaxID=2975747 RepID=UPI0030E5DF41